MTGCSRRRLAGGASGPDRRWSPRRFIAIAVALYENGRLEGWGVTQDIGLEGLFLRMAEPIGSEGAHLELELSLTRGKAEDVLRVPAAVVHRNQCGLGVMFVAFNQELFRAFDVLLDRPALGGTLVEVPGEPDPELGSSS